MIVINEKIPLMEKAVDEMVCDPVVSLAPPFHPTGFSKYSLQRICFTQHDEFLKMAHLIDGLEVLLCEAANTYGVRWAEKPLWRTWSLDQFGRFSRRYFILREACANSVSLRCPSHPRTKLQRQPSLHSFPNTLARITFMHINYFPLFELRCQALKPLVLRWRDGSHSVR